MRTLRFIVNGQSITRDPDCDFTGLVPKSEGYLQAEFAFSSEWDGSTRVAAFFSNLGREYEPQFLRKGRTCIIPAEALEKSIFKVQVIGRKGDYNLCTNRLTVHQKGGKV